MGHEECIGEKRNAYKVFGENLKERDHLGDLCINGSYKQDGNA